MKLSEGVWIAPLRGRVAGTRALMDSVMATDPEARVVAVLAQDDPDFEALVEVLRETPWGVLTMPGDNTVVEKLNHAFAKCAGEGFYGILANDIVLEQGGTLTALAAACPSNGLSYCDDSVHGEALATHPCAGGDLLRAQGWFVYPRAKHNGTDVYLMEMAHLFGGCRFVKGFRMQHNHWTNGRAAMDSTYGLVKSFAEEDWRASQQWKTVDRKVTVLRLQGRLTRG